MKLFKSNMIKIISLVIVLALIGVMNFKNNNIETQVVNKVRDYYSKKDSSVTIMSNDGLNFIKIDNGNLEYYDREMRILNTVKIPFLKNDIQTIDWYRNEVVFSVRRDIEKGSISIFRLKRDTLDFTKVNLDEYILYEVEGLINSSNEYYVKYEAKNSVNENHRFYGYLDLKTNKVISLVEIESENPHDIYIGNKRVFKVNMGDENITVADHNNNVIMSYPRALYSHEYSSSSRFKKLVNYKALVNNRLIYINPTKDLYGRLYLYDVGIGKSKVLNYTLKGNVTNLIPIGENAVIVVYGSDGKSDLYDPNNEFPLLKDNLHLVENTEILKVTQDGNIIQYYLYEGNTSFSRIEVINLKTQSKFTLKEYKPYIEFCKEEMKIKDTNGKNIYYYLLSHKDESSRPYAIFVHGGPFTRYDLSGYEDLQLMLFELGFEVILLNFHGSTGNGVEYYENAGENIVQSTINNIDEVIDWIKLKKEGNQIVVLGSSYGGYATMLAKMDLKSKIDVAIAIAPGSLDDFKLYNFKVFKGLFSSPFYDNFHSALTTEEEIAIVYNANDPQLIKPKNWSEVALRNKNIRILKTFNKGHTISVNDSKSILRYILGKLNFKAESMNLTKW